MRQLDALSHSGVGTVEPTHLDGVESLGSLPSREVSLAGGRLLTPGTEN